MMLVSMLFVLLVLGPLVILGVMALASDERAMAHLRRLLPRPADREAVADSPPDEPGESPTRV